MEEKRYSNFAVESSCLGEPCEGQTQTAIPESFLGTMAIGVQTPIIRTGDNVAETVLKSIDAAKIPIGEGDIIGITESIVARAFGDYATVDDIANDIRMKFLEASNGKHKTGRVIVYEPIYSRNRFATILRGIARAAEEIVLIMPKFDEVGNPLKNHPFTQTDYDNLYLGIADEERAICGGTWENLESYRNAPSELDDVQRVEITIDCHLHDYEDFKNGKSNVNDVWYHLSDILCNRSDWGVLGSNAAGDDRVKLFPTAAQAQDVVAYIQDYYKGKCGINVECLIYGDGCFHSPEINCIKGTSINEFADPVTSPGYTNGLNGSPREVKIKAVADSCFRNLNGYELECAIKETIKESQKCDESNRSSEILLGTTPRRYVDSVASLCDLITGSGQKGTPVVVIKNYFKTYAD